MKLLLSLTLAFIGTIAYAQDFKMVDTTPTKEVKQEVKYDSLTNIHFNKDKEYHKSLIGQSILFYPRNPNSKSLPEYFANFTTPQKLIVAIDTVWYKRRKKPRPSDYKLDTLYTDRYKPQYIDNKGTTLCASTKTITLSNGEYVASYYRQKEEGLPKSMNCTGDLTPYNEIEGKTFKIINIIYKDDVINPLTTFVLLSQKGDTIYWDTDYPKYGNYTDFIYPVITTGYIDKMKQLYLNKYLYILKPSPAKKYKCTELVYSGKENQYMVPSFVLKGDDEDLILPLSLAPSLFSYEIEPYDLTERRDEHTFDKLQLAEATVYEAKLEKEKLAKEEVQKQLIKKYGRTYGTLISEGKVKIGMTKEMCIDAWGKPKSVNKSSGAWGVHEQWVYGLKTYLYFEGNKLTSIQN